MTRGQYRAFERYCMTLETQSEREYAEAFMGGLKTWAFDDAAIEVGLRPGLSARRALFIRGEIKCVLENI